MRLATLVVLAALLLLGCIGSPQPEPPEEQPPGPMEASSIAFVDGERIPEVFTCDGREVSPPFSLAGLPNATRSVALIAADPDVPTPETGTRNFTHWLFWNAQPTDHELAVPRNDTPEGALEGKTAAARPATRAPVPRRARPRTATSSPSTPSTRT